MTYSFDSLVEAVLYRFNCPNTDVLTNHYFYPVPVIAKHVAECPLCTEELETLRQFEDAVGHDDHKPIPSFLA